MGRTVRKEGNIRRVAESVSQSPRRSVRRRLQPLGINRHTQGQIKKKDLQMHPYRLTVRHHLTLVGMQRLIELAEWLEKRPDVPDKLWLSDEAHFYLSGETLQNKVHWEKECRYVLEAIVIVAIVLEASRVPVEMMNRAITQRPHVRLPMLKECGGAHLEHLM